MQSGTAPANKRNTQRKIRQKIFFGSLLLLIELVSNPFQPNQTDAKREQEFSHAVVNAAE